MTEHEEAVTGKFEAVWLEEHQEGTNKIKPEPYTDDGLEGDVSRDAVEPDLQCFSTSNSDGDYDGSSGTGGKQSFSKAQVKDDISIEQLDILVKKPTQGINCNERLHQCGSCSKSFTHRGSLKKHLLTHTGEKPHKCNICGKCFSQSGNLNSHLMTHTNKKPFKCSICPKSFTQSSNLKTHIRMHKGEKPHKCKVCCKHFSQRSTLKAHMVTHAAVKPFPISVT